MRNDPIPPSSDALRHRPAFPVRKTATAFRIRSGRFAAIFFYASLLVLCAPLSAQGPDNDASPPRKPTSASSLGYVHVVSPTRALPRLKSGKLRTKKDYQVVNRSNISIRLAVPDGSSTSFVSLPATTRFRADNQTTVQMLNDMEVRFEQVPVEKGLELPILKTLHDMWIVELDIEGTVFPVQLRRNDSRLVFRKQSRYEIFAEEQRKKGLILSGDKWVDKAELASPQKRADEAIKPDKARLSLLQKSASAGFLLLKNGDLLFGKAISFSKNNHQVEFLCDDASKPKTVRADELDPIPFEDALRIASERKILTLLLAAEPALKESNFPLAISVLGDADRLVRDNPAVFRDAPAQTQNLLRLKSANAQLDRELRRHDLTVHKGHVIPKSELEKRLAAGQILFRDMTWILPDQRCFTCKQTGRRPCPSCQGKGETLNLDCDVCKRAGTVVCPRCLGSGKRPCDACDGLGKVQVLCVKCSGTGQITVDPTFFAPIKTPARTCPDCRGTKKIVHSCRECNGKKVFPCPPRQKCMKCNGQKHSPVFCSDCDSTGKSDCPDCNGHGFTGQPQKIPEDTPPPISALAPHTPSHALSFSTFLRFSSLFT